MTPRVIEFFVPVLIPRALTPNRSRGTHWGTVSKAKATVQEAVRVSALSARARWENEHHARWEPMATARISYAFTVKSRSHIKDDDNVIAGLKSARDILQEKVKIASRTLQLEVDGAALIGNDRGLKTAGISWLVDKAKEPGMTIRLEEVL